MLGYWFVVSNQTPEERDGALRSKDAVLAQWECGLGGLAWIEKLVAEGKAEKLSANGYPNRYTAVAREVLPIITAGHIQLATSNFLVIGLDEGEEYIQLSGWHDNIDLRAEAITACPLESVLTIDAWDQS